jgi:SET domain-containing protein
MRKLVVNNRPHLALFATRDINPGEELQYDYGDDEHNVWWRNEVWSISM